MPYEFCLIYSSLATPGFWLCLEHAKNAPASEAWHFLFPLSGMFFPQTCQWLAPILHSVSASLCPSGEAPLAILLATALWLLCLLTLLYFSLNISLSDMNSTNIFIICLPRYQSTS